MNWKGGKIKRVCEGCGKTFEVFPSVVAKRNVRFCSRQCMGKVFSETRREKASSRWRGGRIQTAGGYIAILLQPDNFFHPMAGPNNYVFEHRLVIAKSLSRNLQSWEIVHHRNHKRDDNRIENLQLIQEMQHNQMTLMGRRIAMLEAKVEDQAKEIRLLEWQNKNRIGVNSE